MEWFFIEALVALAVGIAIVVWTMVPPKKLPRNVAKSAADESGAAPKVEP